VTRRTHRNGNVILEAALVLPILLLLAFGVIEFGYYFYVKNNVQGAAREGARAAITAGATNADVNAAVATAMANSGLSQSGYTITTTPTNVSTTAAGTAVQVTVQCSWGTVGGGARPMRLMSANKVVRASATMRKES
jgi:Flp pilus assembly protein TadG